MAVTAYYSRTHVLRDVYNIYLTLFEFYFLSEYISTEICNDTASDTYLFGFFLAYISIIMFTII